MAHAVKTYEVNLAPDPALPTGTWDPKWNEPEVAIQVAHQVYRRLRQDLSAFDATTLTPPDKLPTVPKKNTEARTFSLAAPRAVEDTGVAFRGGSYGELYRRYAFGPRPAVNFHAQAIAFGVDSEGRFLVQAQVGAVGGGLLGHRGTLVVRFHGARGPLGGVSWEGEIVPSKDVPVRFLGRHDGLRAAFAELTTVTVEFHTVCAA